MNGADALLQVPLDDHHRALGGRMVPFSGYALPVQYPSGIVSEHHWTREHAGLFDVSHMGPCFLTLSERSGDAETDHRAIASLIEPLVCGDIARLRPGQLRYTLLLNAEGGIIDDLLIGRPRDLHRSGALYIVVNSSTKHGDFALIAAAAGSRARLSRADTGVLLALQGPDAAAVMAGLVPGAIDLGFMTFGAWNWLDAPLIISRSGYTGEDGFEILAPVSHGALLWSALLADERVRPVGLGARDSLRLEAGLPLNGHDLDESVSPIEAGLSFAVSRRRREAADFPGAARILAELATAPARVRVGLLVEGAPAREGATVHDANGSPIGKITSGGFSPTLGRAIGLGFVPPTHAAPGNVLAVQVRGRHQAASVAPLPFVAHRYVRKPVP